MGDPVKVLVAGLVACGIFLNTLTAQITFTDNAEALGVSSGYGEGYYAGGVSFFDFNRDGWDDLTLGSEFGSNLRFYLNDQGSFAELYPLVQNGFESKQILWVDYDNDGDYDLYVASITENYLYENDGNFQFENITSEAGLTLTSESYGAAWGDYNNDGWLDLFLTNYDHQQINRLYRNNWDGTFTDVSFEAGIAYYNKASFFGAFLDYNNDGWMDIYVANDRHNGNTLFKNEGDGTFSDVSHSTNAYLEMNSMCVAVGDYNNDDYSDIYITNSPPGNKLLRNNGGDSFNEVAAQLGVGFYGVGWGSNFLDYDNDRDLDLYVSGNLIGSDQISSRMYTNKQENGIFFFQESLTIGFEGDTVSSYVNAIGDIDNDGFTDLVVNNENFPTQIWKNSGASDNNWLKLDLEGTVSNRDAVGSVISVFSDEIKLKRTTHCGLGFMGQNSQHHTIGLGDIQLIDSVEIRWPGGHIDKLYDVGVNQCISIIEGSTNEIHPTIRSNKSNLTLCNNESIILNAGIESSRFLYCWSTGEHTSSITVDTPGNYYVSISGELLSEDIFLETNIGEFPATTAEIIKEDNLCYDDYGGSIIAEVISGTPPYSFEWENGNTSDSRSSLKAGVYTLWLTDGNACTQEIAVTIAQPTPIQVEVANLSSEDGILQINVSGGVEPYIISFQNTAIQNGEELPGLMPGTYDLFIEDANGCSVYRSFEVDVISGINGSDSGEIYPNPATRYFSIKIEESEITNTHIRILDKSGKLVRSPEIRRLDTRILVDVEHLPAGFYIIQIENSSGTQSTRLIKK